MLFLFNLVFLSVAIAYILFVWNNTNVFIEYYKLFKLKFIKSANEYIEQNNAGFIELYVEFLRKKNSFFSKLFSCPICFGFWLGVFTIPFCGIYFLFNCYLSIILYKFIERVANHD